MALVLALAVLAAVLLAQSPLGVVLGSGLFDSPLATPTPARTAPPLPTSTPEPVPSEAAQQALAYIAQREGVPFEALVIVADHPTEYPALGRGFQVVTL